MRSSSPSITIEPQNPPTRPQSWTQSYTSLPTPKIRSRPFQSRLRFQRRRQPRVLRTPPIDLLHLNISRWPSTQESLESASNLKTVNIVAFYPLLDWSLSRNSRRRTSRKPEKTLHKFFADPSIIPTFPDPTPCSPPYRLSHLV